VPWLRAFDAWGLICIAVGCGFLASVLWVYLARKNFLATSQAVAGTVVEVHVRGIGRNAVGVPPSSSENPEGRAQSCWASGSDCQGIIFIP
jgi:hypothetical protein